MDFFILCNVKKISSIFGLGLVDYWFLISDLDYFNFFSHGSIVYISIYVWKKIKLFIDFEKYTMHKCSSTDDRLESFMIMS